MMPNVLQYPVATAAVLRAGYAVVNVNPLYTPRELEHQLKDSGAETIIVLENFATTVQQVMGKTSLKHVIIGSMGDLLGFKGVIVNLVVRKVKKMVPAYSIPRAVAFNDAIAAGRSLKLDKPKLRRDVAFLQYTGGTTGISRGDAAPPQHPRQRAAERRLAAAGAESRRMSISSSSSARCRLSHLRADGVFLLAMGRRRQSLIPTRATCRASSRADEIPGQQLPGGQYALQRPVEYARLDKVDFSKLKTSFGGGMATQKPVAEKWLAVTGCALSEGYGLSETSPTLTCNPADTDQFSGSIGIPVPSTYLSIRDDDGKEVPLGQPGEICAKGPQVMAGYWNRPDETAKVMTPDGFFRSGDIGVMDADGYTKIVDRKKDMILVSGFNVYPNEVEGVVASHPGVLECAAVGVPDENAGEAVKLFVVKKDPALTEKELLEFCKEQLTGYKKPKYIEFRSDLPKTNVGKILRRELRDEKKAA
jgi:long-chain acyl-CoA synthetase